MLCSSIYRLIFPGAPLCGPGVVQVWASCGPAVGQVWARCSPRVAPVSSLVMQTVGPRPHLRTQKLRFG